MAGVVSRGCAVVWLMAAPTAPQEPCARTTITATPSSATANSMVAVVFSLAIWPMLRTTKRSPRPQSKRISAATRESEQPRNAASGAWLPRSSLRRAAFCWGWSRLPAMNRSFPRASSSQACWTVTRVGAMGESSRSWGGVWQMGAGAGRDGIDPSARTDPGERVGRPGRNGTDRAETGPTGPRRDRPGRDGTDRAETGPTGADPTAEYPWAWAACSLCPPGPVRGARQGRPRGPRPASVARTRGSGRGTAGWWTDPSVHHPAVIRGSARVRVSGTLTAVAAAFALRLGGLRLGTALPGLAGVGGVLLTEAAGAGLATFLADLAGVGGILLAEAAGAGLATFLADLAGVGGILLAEAAGAGLAAFLAGLAGVGGILLAEAAGAGVAALLGLLLGIASIAELSGVVLISHHELLSRLPADLIGLSTLLDFEASRLPPVLQHVGPGSNCRSQDTAIPAAPSRLIPPCPAGMCCRDVSVGVGECAAGPSDSCFRPDLGALSRAVIRTRPRQYPSGPQRGRGNRVLRRRDGAGPPERARGSWS